MQPRRASPDRARSRLRVQQNSGSAFSLKARETASLSLGRIFEQQIMISAAAATRSTPSAAANSHHRQASLKGIDHDDQHAENHIDHGPFHDHIQYSSAPGGMDLELRLAVPFTSSSSASDTTQDETVQRMHDQSVISVDSGEGKAQLTILYAGMACTYEDISPHKANAIMLLAAGSEDRFGVKKYAAAAPRGSRPATPASSSSDIFLAKLVTRSQAELPFARKASLARFFEKRKAGLEAKAAPIEADVNSDDATMTATSEDDSQPPHKKPCTRTSFSPTKY